MCICSGNPVCEWVFVNIIHLNQTVLYYYLCTTHEAFLRMTHCLFVLGKLAAKKYNGTSE